jgi:hypothetical protein
MLIEFSQCAAEHRLADNEFADQVHHCVDASSVHAKRAFGKRCYRRTTLLPCTVITAVCGWIGNLRRLRFQDFTQEFVLGRFRLVRSLDANIRHYRGNPTAVGDVLDRMNAGDGRFHDFHGCRGEVVLRPEGNDGATGMENIAHELKCRCPHVAVGIDA